MPNNQRDSQKAVSDRPGPLYPHVAHAPINMGWVGMLQCDMIFHISPQSFSAIGRRLRSESKAIHSQEATSFGRQAVNVNMSELWYGKACRLFWERLQISKIYDSIASASIIRLHTFFPTPSRQKCRRGSWDPLPCTGICFSQCQL